jgi:hypothetical protein
MVHRKHFHQEEQKQEEHHRLACLELVAEKLQEGHQQGLEGEHQSCPLDEEHHIHLHHKQLVVHHKHQAEHYQVEHHKLQVGHHIQERLLEEHHTLEQKRKHQVEHYQEALRKLQVVQSLEERSHPVGPRLGEVQGMLRQVV